VLDASQSPPTAPVTDVTGPRLDLAALSVQLGQRRLTLAGPCRLQAGRLYLVVGRSGSGKSSFARALLGFGELSSPPAVTTGSVKITGAAGEDCAIWSGATYHPAARGKIAFLPQAERLGFLDALSLTDNLALFSHLSEREALAQIERLADHFSLRPLPARLASASGGERIRLSAIRGLLPRRGEDEPPAVIVADEPTAGLDREAAASMVRLLVALAGGGQSVVLVITHEPELFAATDDVHTASKADEVRIIECPAQEDGSQAGVRTVGTLRMSSDSTTRTWPHRLAAHVAEFLGYVGAVALSPLAFLWGLLGLHRPFVLLRQVLADGLGVGTQAFSLTGCLLIAGTAAYFIFERMPKPQLVEQLLLQEIMAATGHALVRVVLPLSACSMVTAKLGAAQAARLASAVRGGLLETLALAGWRVEAYALVPVVLAQFVAMALATAVAILGGILLAAVVYVAGHEGASLPLTVNLMIDGLHQAPHGWLYLLVKIGLSCFLGGAIAALCGIAPSTAEDDVARAVHRTLLWSVLAVIASQCGLIVAEFAN
jgi:putative ABC transport system ATP-binding protein